MTPLATKGTRLPSIPVASSRFGFAPPRRGLWYTLGMRNVTFLVAVGALAGAWAGELVLAERGKPAAYTIVRPEQASPSEK